MHASLQDHAIFETELNFCCFQISIIKRNGTGKLFRVCFASTRGCGAWRWWCLFDPGQSIHGSDDVIGLINLINGDAVIGNDKMEAKEHGDLSKECYGPNVFEDLNNVPVSILSGTHTQEIICWSAQLYGSMFKDTAVNRRICAISKKWKIFIGMLLPLVAGRIKVALNKTVHEDSMFVN